MTEVELPRGEQISVFGMKRNRDVQKDPFSSDQKLKRMKVDVSLLSSLDRMSVNRDPNHIIPQNHAGIQQSSVNPFSRLYQASHNGNIAEEKVNLAEVEPKDDTENTEEIDERSTRDILLDMSQRLVAMENNILFLMENTIYAREEPSVTHEFNLENMYFS